MLGAAAPGARTPGARKTQGTRVGSPLGDGHDDRRRVRPLIAGPAARVAAPEYRAATVVLSASVGLYVNGLMRAEVRHRGESVLDPLTGLLNRATLDQLTS